MSISLLPNSSAKSQTWAWTAGCQFGPYVHKACQSAGPVLGTAQLNADEWNLGAGAATVGSLGMSMRSPGGLDMHGDFRTAPPCTASSCIAPRANTWVHAYPNVLYGINQCHKATSPPESELLPLPIKVSAIPSDLVGVTSYAEQAQHATYDVAYDLWLNDSATRRPCNTNGSIEVMVWTDYDQRGMLPGDMQTASATIPFAVNGVVQPDKSAWWTYVSNVFQKGQTAPWGGTVWFVLNSADMISHGTVSVDLSGVLSAVSSLLQNYYGWTGFGHHYWLDTIPFGMEFGPQSGTLYGAGPAHFTMRFSSYCLDVGTTLSKAACPAG